MKKILYVSLTLIVAFLLTVNPAYARRNKSAKRNDERISTYKYQENHQAGYNKYNDENFNENDWDDDNWDDGAWDDDDWNDDDWDDDDWNDDDWDDESEDELEEDDYPDIDETHESLMILLTALDYLENLTDEQVEKIEKIIEECEQKVTEYEDEIEEAFFLLQDSILNAASATEIHDVAGIIGDLIGGQAVEIVKMHIAVKAELTESQSAELDELIQIIIEYMDEMDDEDEWEDGENEDDNFEDDDYDEDEYDDFDSYEY